MTEKSEALRLADRLEDTESARLHLLPYAAAELRRLHAVNAELLEALEAAVVRAELRREGAVDVRVICAAIAKAKATGEKT